jgi:predicted ribosome quality control (RQC) complex YloA/Tae2 family protein
MILNYHTLFRWVEEVRPDILEAKIIESFSQTRDVLHIGLVNTRREPSHIEISTEPKAAHIVLRRSFQRRSKNSADVFRSMVGQKIVGLRLDPRDRMIYFDLSEGEQLIMEAFGSVNIFLLDSQSKILGAFHRSKESIGLTYERPKKTQEIFFADFESFRQEMKTLENFTSRLPEGLFHFNKYLAMELLSEGPRPSTEPLRDNFNAAVRLLDHLKRDKPRIYWLHEEPKIFSVAELRHWKMKFTESREEVFESVNEGLAVYLTQKFKQTARQKERDELLRACRIRTKKNSRLIADLEAEKIKAEDYSRIERQANLLHLNIARAKRGMDTITVEDAYDEEGRTVAIKLDPHLTPQANVAKYFGQAKKLKNSVKKIGVRIGILEKENEELQNLENSIQNKTLDWNQTNKIHEQYVRSGWIKKTETHFKFDKEEVPAFKSFLVHGHWRVLVGQNDQKNDLLTFKFAKSDDWWFHARGVPGSHVVLKRDGRSDNPSKNAIEGAASIAAYFSKAKTSGLVPVIFTKKKFVRKPKGAKPGQVIVEREEVVIVPPREPVTDAGEP